MDTTTSTGSSAAAIVITVVAIVVYLIYVAAFWQIFRKAGFPGWLAIIPIVNTIYLIKSSGHSGWLVLLYLIPVVNIVVHIMVCWWLSENFGHGVGFTLGLIFLPFIFFLILGFGGSQARVRGA